jgi:hypothetical protein
MPEKNVKTVYVSIGNSDDKLTQREWHDFIKEIDYTLGFFSERCHGNWFSNPVSAFQNACWCVEVPETKEHDLKSTISRAHSQRSDTSTYRTPWRGPK